MTTCRHGHCDMALLQLFVGEQIEMPSFSWAPGRFEKDGNLLVSLSNERSDRLHAAALLHQSSSQNEYLFQLQRIVPLFHSRLADLIK